VSQHLTRTFFAWPQWLSPNHSMSRLKVSARHTCVAVVGRLPRKCESGLMKPFTGATAAPKVSVGCVLDVERFIVTHSRSACDVRATRVLPSDWQVCGRDTSGPSTQWTFRKNDYLWSAGTDLRHESFVITRDSCAACCNS
jgi:hypothetical protein